MPFQTSPGKDDGYDISDYYIVEPRYGTLGDFVEFTHGCKQRGIRVIIDLVVNHTSDQHQWFREARRDRGIRAGKKRRSFPLAFNARILCPIAHSSKSPPFSYGR